MTDVTVFKTYPANPPIQRQLAIFALSLAGCTLLLMALGSATRVMNAGLSCPDWPLCYGTLLPQRQMNLQVFLEWFHRLVASTIGFATIVLAAVTFKARTQLPIWAPWATAGALLLVVLQGVLGGLTVTELLRFDIVTGHLGTGLAFFCTLLTIGLLLLDYRPSAATRSLKWLGVIAIVCIYAQSLLGGLVASQWAVHQCFAGTQLCTVLNRHLLGIVPATIATLALVGRAGWLTAKRQLDSVSQRFTFTIAGLLLAQLAIGYLTFRLRLQVEPLTVTHQAVGAALLGALVGLTALSFKE
jgi:heme a synthase